MPFLLTKRMDQSDFHNWLNNANVLLELIAALTGIYFFKKAARPERLFIGLLAFGFLNDFLTGFCNVPNSVSYICYNIYSLLEAIVFFTYLMNRSVLKIQYTLSQVCRILFVILWIFLHRQNLFTLTYFERLNPIYEGLYQVTTSFLAGFGLLMLIERSNNATRFAPFWILLAIFFSGFGSFFMSLMANQPIMKQFWFLYNSINMFCYIFITIGFLRIKRESTDMAIFFTSR